ncbi:MAG: hypothetical protein QXJ93_01975 [Candidatus Rehaiarchaeum fermentans]|nr:hypothetical protein [Candidatus Rehaiarchaeum fermentans]
MKTPRRFLISALVFASGVAFADVNPFAEIQNKPNTACSVIEYGLGFIEIALALSPFVIGAVVAFEAYKHTKQ